MKIKIYQSARPEDRQRVSPDFIYNRFDLFCSEDEFETVTIKSRGRSSVVQYRVVGDRAELGLWLVPITADELEALLKYVAEKHPEVKTISYKNGVLPFGKARSHNHFRIVFPDTVEEMESRISGKSRSKLRKKLRRAEAVCGEARFVEYDRESLPAEIVEAFFRFKLAIRGRAYDMTPEEYLDRYHVSHCYVLMLGDTLGAIRFSCEQCPVVYGENFTYNPELQDYSLGRIIFIHHLNRMVEKNHTELFFAGGDYEYKTHYGSIEETLYDCDVKVTDLYPPAPAPTPKKSLIQRAKGVAVRILPAPVSGFLSKVRHKLFG